MLVTFLLAAILVDLKWHHILALICISLNTKGVEHQFACFLYPFVLYLFGCIGWLAGS